MVIFSFQSRQRAFNLLLWRLRILRFRFINIVLIQIFKLENTIGSCSPRRINFC